MNIIRDKNEYCTGRITTHIKEKTKRTEATLHTVLHHHHLYHL